MRRFRAFGSMQVFQPLRPREVLTFVAVFIGVASCVVAIGFGLDRAGAWQSAAQAKASAAPMRGGQVSEPMGEICSNSGSGLASDVRNPASTRP
ncbi:hypothetical protein [Hyphomicrobium sp.]|uniref:hypothetical protein n=1 Tax=Hyphomicrobium sp. TaxID=82 RepID=UPI002C972BA4|nr:hypothetical protein [Hyphomicrobium sp.]HRN87446.1 hypothetical protein [Hyphomicrobium sp.]HRQ26170.1 hypothetical protein [Hyphomicrobium sp.]